MLCAPVPLYFTNVYAKGVAADISLSCPGVCAFRDVVIGVLVGAMFASFLMKGGRLGFRRDFGTVHFGYGSRVPVFLLPGEVWFRVNIGARRAGVFVLVLIVGWNELARCTRPWTRLGVNVFLSAVIRV